MTHNQYDPYSGVYQLQPGGYQQQGYTSQVGPGGQPPLPQIPGGTDLSALFKTVDKDKSGEIVTKELQETLVAKGPFNPETVRLLIAMFDADNNGSIKYEEFSGLWKYVVDWQNTFRIFDRNNSGTIDQNDLKTAVTSFGYRLSDRLYMLLIKKFDRTGKGVIAFDDFTQCIVVIETLTKSFKTTDINENGWIQVSYEQLLSMVFRVRP